MGYLSCCLTYIYIYIYVLCVYIFYIHNHPEINRMDFANKKHHGNTRLLNLFHIPFCIYSRTLGWLFIAIWLTGWPVTFMLSRKLSIIENGQILGLFSSLDDPAVDFKIPSGKRLHNYGKSPFWMGKSTISMVIFNSYVKLPEGIWITGKKENNCQTEISVGLKSMGWLKNSPRRWSGHVFHLRRPSSDWWTVNYHDFGLKSE